MQQICCPRLPGSREAEHLYRPGTHRKGMFTTALLMHKAGKALSTNSNASLSGHCFRN
jgi:hypothetical protein